MQGSHLGGNKSELKDKKREGTLNGDIRNGRKNAHERRRTNAHLCDVPKRSISKLADLREEFRRELILSPLDLLFLAHNNVVMEEHTVGEGHIVLHKLQLGC